MLAATAGAVVALDEQLPLWWEAWALGASLMVELWVLLRYLRWCQKELLRTH